MPSTFSRKRFIRAGKEPFPQPCWGRNPPRLSPETGFSCWERGCTGRFVVGVSWVGWGHLNLAAEEQDPTHHVPVPLPHACTCQAGSWGSPTPRAASVAQRFLHRGAPEGTVKLGVQAKDPNPLPGCRCLGRAVGVCRPQPLLCISMKAPRLAQFGGGDAGFARVQTTSARGPGAAHGLGVLVQPRSITPRQLGGGLQPQAALRPPRLPASSTVIFPLLLCSLQNSAPRDAQLSTQPLPCMLSF